MRADGCLVRSGPYRLLIALGRGLRGTREREAGRGEGGEEGEVGGGGEGEGGRREVLCDQHLIAFWSLCGGDRRGGSAGGGSYGLF